jgi:4-amino-4-deoxy-L-arabinose transferase-like glycosyltransferase
MNSHRTVALLSMFLLSFYLLLASLRIGSGDGETIYQVTRSLVDGQGFAIPPPLPGTIVVDELGEPIPPEQLREGGQYGAWGVDGRFYAQYGVGQSLLAVPFYLAGRGIQKLVSWGTADFASRAAVMFLSPLALSLACGVLYLLARQLGYGQNAALAVALVVGLATPLWVYSKMFFSEPLVTLAFVVATLSALRADEGSAGYWIVCGAALGMAVLVKPVSLAVAPAFLAYALLRRTIHWRPLLLVAGPLAGAVIAVGGYNLARFGSPLDTGYRTAAWDVLPWVGLYGLLLSPGRGLLWYCPPLVLGIAGFPALARWRPRPAALLGGTCALYLLAHATYNCWHGGGAWGPRLILPIVPLLLLPAGLWLQRSLRQGWQRLGLAAIVAAGSIVQWPAMLVHPARTLQALYDRSASPTEFTLRQLYRPADSLLLGQWRSLAEAASLMRDAASRESVLGLARQANASASQAQDGFTEAAGVLALNFVDLWPVTWGLLGMPAAAVVVGELVLAGLAAWAAWQLYKMSLRRPESRVYHARPIAERREPTT